MAVGDYADIGLGTFIDFGGTEYCIQTVDGPNTEIAEDIEVTNSCSQQKEYIPGIPDGGTITMTINFDPAQPIIPDRVEKPFTLWFPLKKEYVDRNGNVVPGEGFRRRYVTRAYVKTAPVSIDVNNVMTQSATFKITGDEQWF